VEGREGEREETKFGMPISSVLLILSNQAVKTASVSHQHPANLHVFVTFLGVYTVETIKLTSRDLYY
jgi:hypothetical protein